MDGFSDTTRADQRRRVLEMLQRGQINAAEADEVMAALEGRPTTKEPQAESLPPVPGLVAAVASLARVLARGIAGLSVALGRLLGVLGRLSGRARAQ